MQPTIGIIGAGKVGNVLARLLYESGYSITSVYSRTPEHDHALAEKVGSSVVTSAKKVIDKSDLTIVAVSDDALMSLFGDSPQVDWRQKAIAHTSGALDTEVFSRISKSGIWRGSLHPAFAFSDVEIALKNLRGTPFAIEADEPVLRDWLLGLVNALDGSVIEIAPGKKALYHAALVIFSNYTVTLYALAQKLLIESGADDEGAGAALNALMGVMIQNLQQKGIPWALTGPLTRADLGTVKRHIGVLYNREDLLEMYKGLARLTYPLLHARQIPDQFIDELEALFTAKAESDLNAIDTSRPSTDESTR